MMQSNLLHVYLRLDPHTRDHCYRVRSFSVFIGAMLGLPQNELRTLAVAAQLHDIGKVAVDPEILQQSTPLTERQWQIIQEHPNVGAEIWRAFGGSEDVERAIRFHHERFDGRGYPEGLQAEQIPLMSRVISIADALDAMLSHRPYSPARPLQEALLCLMAASGEQFDPAIVSSLFRHARRATRSAIHEFPLAA